MNKQKCPSISCTSNRGRISDECYNCGYSEALSARDKEVKQLEQALEGDEADFWKVTNAIKREIASHNWITEGRGSYKWNDDRYREETKIVFDAVLKIIDEAQSPASRRYHKALKSEMGVK